MPYLHCPRCRLTTYSPVSYTHVETCPRCGADLGTSPRALFELRPARRVGARRGAAAPPTPVPTRPLENPAHRPEAR